MIIAYINGQVAYPSSQGDVKIDLQNPFIKDGDEKTMEIVFPLAIPENREVFGHIERLDTSFESEDFENVRLMAEGNLIIEGVGTITQITPMEIRLQILSGKSYLRYKSYFDKIYIDQIDYGTVEPRHKTLNYGKVSSMSSLDLTSELNSQGFIGVPGKYAFLPIHDEDNDIECNAMMHMINMIGHSYFGLRLVNAAVQPNFMMVAERVFQKLGYKIEENTFNVKPWSDLYIASAKMGSSLAKALPHWSCYKFIDEFRKLFNAVFLFDEKKKTVRIVPFGESGNNGVEYIEPLEDYTVGYDEEGIEYLEASNLEYQLSDCDRTEDVVSQDLINAFDFREFESINDLYRAFDLMTTREKMTTIMHCPVGYFYGIPVVQNDRITSFLLKECGWFSPLIRKEGANTIQLNIVPVAMQEQDFTIYGGLVWDTTAIAGGQVFLMFLCCSYHFKTLVANINVSEQTVKGIESTIDDNEEEEQEPDMSADFDFITVQDVMENGEAVPENGSEDSQMEVFFASGQKVKYTELEEDIRRYFGIFGGFDISAAWHPIAYTEYRNAVWHAPVPQASMALTPSSMPCIGNFHNSGTKIRRNINGNNEICIKFMFNGKPDPKKIYMIKNRKFICSHIEMAISNNQLSPLKTGYFYEVID